MHFISASCNGHTCKCGRSSTHKIGEIMPDDEPCYDCNEAWRYPVTLDGWSGPPTDPRCSNLIYHLAGPASQRHEFTAYCCCVCFRKLFGHASQCPLSKEDLEVVNAYHTSKFILDI